MEAGASKHVIGFCSRGCGGKKDRVGQERLVGSGDVREICVVGKLLGIGANVFEPALVNGWQRREVLEDDFVNIFGGSIRSRLFAGLFIWRNGELKNVGLVGKIAKVVIDGVGHALEDAILEAISARAKPEAERRLGKIEQLAGYFFIEFGIFALERWVDVDGAAEFGALEDFFNAKRVNRDVGEGRTRFVGGHAGEAVSGVLEENETPFLSK